MGLSKAERHSIVLTLTAKTEVKMKTLALVLAVSLYMAAPPSGAAIFSCEFQQEVKVSSLNLEKLEPRVSPIVKRYVFSIDETGKGKSLYKSMVTDSEDYITALPFGAGWIILEGGWTAGVPNEGHNFFMVTVFTNKIVNGKHPAIMGFYAFEDFDFYYPSQSFGYCE